MRTETTQVANSFWLPVVLIFILLLVKRRDLMGDQTNTHIFNVVAWTTSAAMIALTAVLVYTSLFSPS